MFFSNSKISTEIQSLFRFLRVVWLQNQSTNSLPLYYYP